MPIGLSLSACALNGCWIAFAGQVPFGLYLARHYHFMLDYVFVEGVRAAHSEQFALPDPNPRKLYDVCVFAHTTAPFRLFFHVNFV